MERFFLFILLSYGITNIVIFGSIFEWLRNFMNSISPTILGKLFSCPMCFSTWIGFILSYIFGLLNLYTPFLNYGVGIVFLRIFLDGCITSGSVWIIHTIQEFFEK
jgi:hypothetical protein